MREARSITFRLNSRNPDDMEILNWLRQVVDQEHIFESTTEAVKTILLSNIHEVIRRNKEDNLSDTIEEFIRRYAEENRGLYEAAMQDFSTKMLAGIIGAMGQGQLLHVPIAKQPIIQQTTEQTFVSPAAVNTPLDESAKLSLAAMFGDEDN